MQVQTNTLIVKKKKKAAYSNLVSFLVYSSNHIWLTTHCEHKWIYSGSNMRKKVRQFNDNDISRKCNC